MLKTSKDLAHGMRLSRHWVLLAALLAACSDGTMPTDTKHSKSPPMPALAVLYDGQINPVDSYVAEDVSSTESAVLEFSSPVYDPEVDGMVYSMQLPTEYESDHVEGGYGYDGSTRINSYNWGGEEYNSGLASSTLINDVLTFYDAAGNAIAPLAPTVFTESIGTTTVNSIGSGPGGGGGYCPESHPDCGAVLMTNLIAVPGSSLPQCNPTGLPCLRLLTAASL